MLIQKQQKKSLMYQHKHYVGGQMKEKSTTLQQKVNIEDTTSKKQKKIPIKKKSSMPVFPVRNKSMISIDKSNFLNLNIQNIKLSPILVQELISKEKDLSPFWTNYSAKISKKLLSVQKIDSQDSGSICSNISFVPSVLNSNLKMTNLKPQKKNSPKIYYQSFRFLQQDSMVQENIKFTRKIKFFPSTDLKIYLEKCFGASRFFYNKTVEYINSEYEKNKKKYDKDVKKGCAYKNKKGNQCCKKISKNSNYFCNNHIKQKPKLCPSLNFIELRNKLVTKNTELKENEKWQEEIPFDLRQNIIKDAITAFKVCISNKKAGNIDKFKVGFRDKKNLTQIFHIPQEFINFEKKMLFPSKKLKFHMTKKEQKEFKKIEMKKRLRITVLRKYPNKYYFCIPLEKKQEKIKPKFNVISCDPNVRNFMSIYSSDGIYGKLGENITDRTDKIQKRLDYLEMLKNFVNKKKRYRIKRRCSLLRNKIKNIIEDFQWKCANFLCVNFETIIMPIANIKSKIEKNGKRVINKKVVRRLTTLRHYSFINKLEHKAKMLKRNLIKCSEEFTTQTCGNCGELNKKIGGKEVFICEKCKYKEDRDINASRNILIRCLTKLIRVDQPK